MTGHEYYSPAVSENYDYKCSVYCWCHRTMKSYQCRIWRFLHRRKRTPTKNMESCHYVFSW